MSPLDPSFLPKPPAGDAVEPPFVLPVDPGAVWVPHGADLPPFVLPVDSEPRPPHPGFWWSVLWCLGYLVVTQIVAVFVVVLVMFIVDSKRAMREIETPAGQAQLQDRIMMPAIACSVLFSVLIAWSVIRLVVGRDWKRQLALRRPAGVHVILVVLSVPGLLVLGSITHLVASQVLPGFKDLGLPDITTISEQLQSWPWWITVLVIGVGPGVGEELWCRGFLGRGLVARDALAVAGVALTSVFFGLLHIDPPHAVAAFAMGLVLHFVYLTTRSLWMPILMHFLNNSASVLSGLPALATLEEAMAKSPWMIAAAAVLLLGAVGWALYQSRSRLAPTGEGGWQSEFPGVEYPPAGSDAAVVHSRPTVLTWALVVGSCVLFGLAGYLGGR